MEISNQWFLVGYGLATIGAFVITMLVQRWMFRGHPIARKLDVYEMAYLTGAEKHVLATALTGLRAEGVLKAGQARVRLTPAESPGRGDLDRAVVRAVGSHDVLRATDLLNSPEVVRELSTIHDRLAGTGLVEGGSSRSKWTLATLPLWAVTAAGIARLGVWVGSDQDFNYLVGAVLVALMTALVMTLKYTPVTRAGRTVLANLRDRNKDLDPDAAPTMDAYSLDPERARLSAALFGTAALTSIDPAYSKAGKATDEAEGMLETILRPPRW